MRRVIVAEFLTLDGVMEAPDKWSPQFWNDEIAKFKSDEHFVSDALLLGRVTYQGFAAAWPSRVKDEAVTDKMSDEDAFAHRMNDLPKGRRVNDAGRGHLEKLAADSGGYRGGDGRAKATAWSRHLGLR